MIARRLQSLEASMGIAIMQMDSGGPAPTLAQMLGWMRVLRDTRDIAGEHENAALAIPVPPITARPIPIGLRPRLTLHQGGRP